LAFRRRSRYQLCGFGRRTRRRISFGAGIALVLRIAARDRCRYVAGTRRRDERNRIGYLRDRTAYSRAHRTSDCGRWRSCQHSRCARRSRDNADGVRRVAGGAYAGARDTCIAAQQNACGAGRAPRNRSGMVVDGRRWCDRRRAVRTVRRRWRRRVDSRPDLLYRAIAARNHRDRAVCGAVRFGGRIGRTRSATRPADSIRTTVTNRCADRRPAGCTILQPSAAGSPALLRGGGAHCRSGCARCAPKNAPI
jgi:hypothetical protein